VKVSRDKVTGQALALVEAALDQALAAARAVPNL
jgi:hypothetical protein